MFVHVPTPSPRDKSRKTLLRAANGALAFLLINDKNVRLSIFSILLRIVIQRTYSIFQLGTFF